ncbi:MAG: protein kinase [Gemmatimonadota bacterium]|nr:protein kinase [Gemmatimonadota bacterium]
MPDVPDTLRAALAERYELEALVGRGGMATVYRARDVKHGRRVAVKVLRSDLSEVIGPERFLREIEIAARLTHPNILPLYDSGEADGTLYYVMPFIADESLRGLLSRVGLMDTEGALEITRRLADALDYAHRLGIVHRDIKPENVLLPGGQAVLTDFGIAKAVSGATSAAGLTRTGIALGTPGYMSPEQASGLLELGPATDVYSLGVVTYEMLVGALPRAWVLPEALRAGRFTEVPPDHRQQLDRLEPGTERALVRALALRSEERFVTPGEFAAALLRPETLAVPVRATPDLAPVPAPEPAELAPRRTPRLVTPAPVVEPPVAPFLGAPTHLVLERLVEGEVDPEEFPGLIEEIRATFNLIGYSSSTDRSLIWTGRRPKKPLDWTDWGGIMESMGDDDNPNVIVRIVTRPGHTRIRVEQRLGETAGGIFGGIVGGAGGGGGGTLLGVGLGAFGWPVALVLPAAVLLVGGSYVLSRTIYRTVAATKRRTLETLMDRLVEYCAEVAR